MEFATEFANPTKAAPTDRMLVVIADPLQPDMSSRDSVPLHLLSLHAELKAMKSWFEPLPYAIEIKAKIAISDHLQQIFGRDCEGYDIIHFIGRGISPESDTALVCENREGQGLSTSASEITKLLMDREAPPCWLAVISAHNGGRLRDVLVSAGVLNVVSINVNDALLDKVTHSFAKHFYPALFQNKTVAEAFEYAHRALCKENRQFADILSGGFTHSIDWNTAVQLQSIAGQENRPLPLKKVNGTVFVAEWEYTNIQPYIKSEIPMFVGRRTDMQQIVKWLYNEQTQIISIHGLPGMGKTALAVAVAQWQLERGYWRNGVWFVELRNITRAWQAKNEIISIINRYEVTMDNKSMLIVLDDLDKLLSEDIRGAQELMNWLYNFLQVKVIITTRQDKLGRLIHQRHHVQVMDRTTAWVAFQRYAPSVEEWQSSQSYQEDRDRLLEILDGYPFPIRLATTFMQVQSYSLATLRQRMDTAWNEVLTEIEAGDESSDLKESSGLEATLRMAYTVLPQQAQDMFPLMALFPAGLDGRAARAVIGDTSENALEELFRYSMVELRQVENSTRYALPEPARRFAERLQPSGTKEHYIPIALNYFYQLIQVTEAEEGVERVQRLLSVEQPNLEVFLDWGMTFERSIDRLCRSARITALLVKYGGWKIDERNQDMLERLEIAKEAAKRNDDRRGMAQVLKVAGDVLQSLDNSEAAVAIYQATLKLYEELEDNLEVSRVWRSIGDVQKEIRQPEEVVEYYRNAVKWYRIVEAELNMIHIRLISDGELSRAKRLELQQVGVQREIADVFRLIGDLQQSWQDFEGALASFEEAVSLYVKVNNFLEGASILKRIGDLRMSDGKLSLALSDYQRASSLYNKVRVSERKGQVLVEWASVQLSIGDIQRLHYRWQEAIINYWEAWSLYRESDNQQEMARVRTRIIDDILLDVRRQADHQVQQGVEQKLAQPEVGLAHFEQAEALYETLNTQLENANMRLNAVKDFEGAARIRQEMAHVQQKMAHVFRAIGDFEVLRRAWKKAESHYRKALMLYRGLGQQSEMIDVQRTIEDLQRFREAEISGGGENTLKQAPLVKVQEKQTPFYDSLSNQVGQPEHIPLESSDRKSELYHLKRILEIKYRRWRKLKEQAAVYGPWRVPPEISIESEDLEEEIRKIEQDVQSLERGHNEMDLRENIGTEPTRNE